MRTGKKPWGESCNWPFLKNMLRSVEQIGRAAS
jgi:hypothetical protein